MSFTTHNDDGGAAASMGDFLLNKLMPFMQNEALWVANQSPASLTLPDAEIFTHAGTVGVPAAPFAFFRATEVAIVLATGTGIDTGEEYFDQPGNPAQSPIFAGTDFSLLPWSSNTNARRSGIQMVNKLQTGALTGHYLFTDGDGSATTGTYVYAAIEVAPNDFRHMWIGEMQKFGAFTGGTFLCGHYLHDAVADVDNPYDTQHIPPDSLTLHTNTTSSSEDKITRSPIFRAAGLRTGVEWWASNGASNVAMQATVNKTQGTINTPQNIGFGGILGGGHTVGSSLFMAEANTSARAKPLIPYIFVASFFQEGQFHYGAIGQIPDIFRFNMNGFSPNDTLSIGSDTFRVYPSVNNDSSVGADQPYSGFEGFAYKVT